MLLNGASVEWALGWVVTLTYLPHRDGEISSFFQWFHQMRFSHDQGSERGADGIKRKKLVWVCVCVCGLVCVRFGVRVVCC